ncbi:MAG: LON peptidase substrate-binding domain-containing protein, partial [Longimicrobiales bacterium]
MAHLTRTDETVELPDELPVVALRDLVFFPYMVLPLLIGRPASLAALEAAGGETDGLLLLVAQRDPSCESPDASDVFTVGTVARVVQVTTLPDGTRRVVLEGLGRGRIDAWSPDAGGGLRARVAPFVDRELEAGDAPARPTLEALARSVSTSSRSTPRSTSGC